MCVCARRVLFPMGFSQKTNENNIFFAFFNANAKCIGKSCFFSNGYRQLNCVHESRISKYLNILEEKLRRMMPRMKPRFAQFLWIGCECFCDFFFLLFLLRVPTHIPLTNILKMQMFLSYQHLCAILMKIEHVHNFQNCWIWFEFYDNDGF